MGQFDGLLEVRILQRQGVHLEVCSGKDAPSSKNCACFTRGRGRVVVKVVSPPRFTFDCRLGAFLRVRYGANRPLARTAWLPLLCARLSNFASRIF